MTHLPLLGKQLFEEMFILYVCELQVLREKIDTHYSKGTPMSFDAVPLHDVAAVLKLFLRELPDPLLTSERVNAFIKIDSKCTFSLLTTYRIFSSTFTVICSYLAFLFNAIESTHTHTHTRLTALFPGLPGWAGTRKVKPIWILLKQKTVSGSGISWAYASLHLAPDR